MIEHIIAWSIRNRWLVIASGVLLALAGVCAVRDTPMDAIPNLSENQVVVYTEWMGHSPREVEDQITYPLSVQLQGMAGVRTVRSSSDFNFSMIHVIFEDSVDFYFARQQVNERLARATDNLVPGVRPQLAPDGVATGQIYWYTVEGTKHDLGQLRTIQDTFVRTQLESVPGVAEVASVGGFPLEYQILISPHSLAERGLTPAAVIEAVARSNNAVGGHVLQKAGAEYLVRGVGWLGVRADGQGESVDPRQVVRDLERIRVSDAGAPVTLVADVAKVKLGAGFRRGVLEKDGVEVTGGVVLMRYGHNPLEVTRAIQHKLRELRAGLPEGVRIVSGYDRTPLIQGALSTVTRTVLEAMLTATVLVLLVLLHFRASLVIAVTLPLAALGSFVVMWILRHLGWVDIQTNIMSLAGIAISVGVLVDSSIVMAENVMHVLRDHFGDRPVQGDARHLVLRACTVVGRPIFFSVLIMLLSFLPVFALGGLEGKMFHPLAFTKSFALLAVAGLAITLVPALCTVLVRGRMRTEQQSWLVRSVMDVYRPVLAYLMDRPAALVWVMGVTMIAGLAPLASSLATLTSLCVALVACGWLFRAPWSKLLSMASLVALALVCQRWMAPLEREFITPLDEGMVMDMPITIPRASVTQSGDDLRARDMVLCHFPEVLMVLGKAGRAETPTDPAPLDMIETMVELREPRYWPKRKLREQDARRQTELALESLLRNKFIARPRDESARQTLLDEALQESLRRFDAVLREVAYQHGQQFARDFGRDLVSLLSQSLLDLAEERGATSRAVTVRDRVRLTQAAPAWLNMQLGSRPALEDVARLTELFAEEAARDGLLEGAGAFLTTSSLWRQWEATLWNEQLAEYGDVITRLHRKARAEHDARWQDFLGRLNADLRERAAPTFTRILLEELLSRATVTDSTVAESMRQLHLLREAAPKSRRSSHHGASMPAPVLTPHAGLDALRKELVAAFEPGLLLWRADRHDLAGFGTEMDAALQMPGWTNVWTMPIQNRVDMLATGVNTAIGIRVLGRDLDQVVKVSEQISAIVKQVPGAADVVADPIRGKGYLEIHVDRDRAAEWNVDVGEVNDVVEIALGGKQATMTVEGRERHPVTVRYARDWCDGEQEIRELLVRANVPTEHGTRREYVTLGEVASVRIVDGPATIKSENGLLRNYVRLNVRDRGSVDFVQEARAKVNAELSLPPGVYLEWTGQFEHELRAGRTLALIVPIVCLLILLILYATYRDLADTFLMMLAVPGAIAGGVFFQWLFGYKFSITVWVGYIACFGMATSTGIIMLVYLRQAVAERGGLEKMSLGDLRQAVLHGAVQRLRPKLLTEGTTILGLIPMLWATGTGAEVIRPMVAPVLGGILIADEVIDLFLPVLFYWVRRLRWHALHQGQTTSRLLWIGVRRLAGLSLDPIAPAEPVPMAESIMS